MASTVAKREPNPLVCQPLTQKSKTTAGESTPAKVGKVKQPTGGKRRSTSTKVPALQPEPPPDTAKVSMRLQFGRTPAGTRLSMAASCFGAKEMMAYHRSVSGRREVERARLHHSRDGYLEGCAAATPPLNFPVPAAPALRLLGMCPPRAFLSPQRAHSRPIPEVTVG